jgi:Kef-type K+ transport system membrane component KefB
MSLSNIVLNEIELGRIFLSILILLISAHLFGYVFNKISLPRVVGEIFGGVIIGPSGLGNISPDSYNHLFNFFPEEGKILSFIYWVGLVLLMLTAGFKFNKASYFQDRKLIFNLLISSTILPILGGVLYFYLYDFTAYKGISGNNLSLSIVVCISIAITSIPVISKIFIDLGIMDSRFAKIVLATATLHDLILWVALDVALKTSPKDNFDIFLGGITTILFLMFSLFIGQPLIHYLNNFKVEKLSTTSSLSYILIICLLMIIMTNYLGINIIFGALMAGIMVGALIKENFKIAKDAIANFSLAFFIPIYFAIVGLKINLLASFDLKLFLAFLFISSLLEIGSVVLGLWLVRKDLLTCFNFGFAMNTRGGPGIVIASLAYEFSIINETFFVVLILVAIATSVISGAWFRFILRQGWPLYSEGIEIAPYRNRVLKVAP